MDVLQRGLGLSFTPGGTLSGWGTADGVAHIGTTGIVYLEVEQGQQHPDTNVLKYWPWIEERPDVRVTLIQVFGPWSSKRRGNRSELAKWVGARMEASLPGRFRYCRLDLGFAEFDDQRSMTMNALTAMGHDLQEH